MALQLVTAPATPPVSRDMVKAHLKVEHTDDDALIDAYIAAETAYAEDFMGRALVAQTWDFYLDAFPVSTAPQIVELPLAEVISVEDVFYLDADGSEQTMGVGIYDVDLASQPARLSLTANASWPTIYAGNNAVRVRLTAGSQDNGSSPGAPNVLKDVQLALMLRVQADYDGGDQAQALRDAADIYLRRHRVHLALA